MIKSGFLKFHINQKKVDEHLVFGDVSGAETLHQNINKVLPGQIIIYNFEDIKKIFYYSLEKFCKNSNKIN